jgi:putative Mg2+ transporter-C (MgtC) family protein
LDTHDLVARLIVAAVAGAIVGLERERGDHSAGFRTHTLVSVGACLFTIAGAYGFADIPRSVNVDPARIAAQVVTGIGFLGAGAIIREGPVVRGLTTAATLWIAAAAGLTAGGGAYRELTAALMIVVGLLLLRSATMHALSRVGKRNLLLSIDHAWKPKVLGNLLVTVRSVDSDARLLTSIEHGDGHGHTRTRLRLRVHRSTDVMELLHRLREHEGVAAVHVEDGPRPARRSLEEELAQTH